MEKSKSRYMHTRFHLQTLISQRIGSFGTVPRAIREKQREFQDESEARPDEFIRYTYPRLLDESREALGKLLNVPTSTVVFVPNATTGVNTVLRNLVWNEDGKDEILYFSTIYGACGLTVRTPPSFGMISYSFVACSVTTQTCT